MQNKPFRFGPQLLQTAAASILQPPNLANGVVDGTTFPTGVYADCYILLTHIHVVNTTAGVVTVSSAINPAGATVNAGTSTPWFASSVPATTSGTNWLDWYGRMRIDADEFFNALCSVASGCTIQGEGELGIF